MHGKLFDSPLSSSAALRLLQLRSYSYSSVATSSGRGGWGQGEGKTCTYDHFELQFTCMRPGTVAVLNGQPARMQSMQSFHPPDHHLTSVAAASPLLVVLFRSSPIQSTCPRALVVPLDYPSLAPTLTLIPHSLTPSDDACPSTRSYGTTPSLYLVYMLQNA
jgi:hypothetical protein